MQQPRRQPAFLSLRPGAPTSRIAHFAVAIANKPSSQSRQRKRDEVNVSRRRGAERWKPSMFVADPTREMSMGNVAMTAPDDVAPPTSSARPIIATVQVRIRLARQQRNLSPLVFVQGCEIIGGCIIVHIKLTSRLLLPPILQRLAEELSFRWRLLLAGVRQLHHCQYDPVQRNTHGGHWRIKLC